MSILKGALGGIGAGMGAMALLNEEEGGTFTSYPEPSRLKQLMGKNNNFDAFGEELKEWENKPWDRDNDPEYVNKTMQRLHRELTNELDTM